MTCEQLFGFKEGISCLTGIELSCFGIIAVLACTAFFMFVVGLANKNNARYYEKKQGEENSKKEQLSKMRR